jgi:hypothetical protein
MRIEARRAFAAAYGNARSWLERLADDAMTTINDLATIERRTERSIRQTLSLLSWIQPSSRRRSRDGCLAGSG